MGTTALFPSCRGDVAAAAICERSEVVSMQMSMSEQFGFLLKLDFFFNDHDVFTWAFYAKYCG